METTHQKPGFDNKNNLPEKLLKPYNAAETEPAILKTWDASGFFNPDVCVQKGVTKPDAEHFSIVLPPPNVTGTLHTGHALMLVIQDIMVRYQRMLGKKTLWLPGTDHAAIATQSKVEKLLDKEGIKKQDLSREEFLKRVEAFAQESHDTIVNQAKTMGASLDWSREAYTLDDKRNLAVRTAFKTMYDDGLIYRKYRVVNWDPKGQTVISDDEIVYEERMATLYTFKYSKDFPISISTTRPETKVGDCAVAVHPDDARYQQYIGKEYDAVFCGVPIHIKIIADENVEPEFGTGALGVTPAHSQIDWAMAQKNNLPVEPVINEYAKMTVGDDRLLGKKTTEAREIIAQWLRDEGLMEKEESIKQNVSTAERTGAIIEPLPKLQWFVDVNKQFPMKDSHIEGISKGDMVSLKSLMLHVVTMKGENPGLIEVLPDRFQKSYMHWVGNLQDWCISRQIWFGHRIPVWYKSPEITWDHKFNIPKKFEWLRSGVKKFEIRAGKKEGWEDHKPGDVIRFTLVEKTLEEKPVPEITPVIKRLVSNKKFSSIDELLEHIDLQDIAADMEKEEYVKAWTDNPDFVERISMYGIYAWELADVIPETFCGIEAPAGEGWSQDPDTLDTWFSSSMWTFSTLGWPDTNSADLKTYHPNSVIETGYDILPIWVARMILMSTYLLGEVPFKTVYLHGMVRAADGQKMSKSLGNAAADPLDIIAKYGNDALRMAMIIGNTPGNDLKLDENNIRGYSKFANKIWNATRFVLDNIADLNFAEPIDIDTKLDAEDAASLAELHALLETVTKEMDEFKFSLAGEKLYHYFWHTFADIIIERSKAKIAGAADEANPSAEALVAARSAKWILYAELTLLIKALHPFMPFITEEVWSMLPKVSDGLIGDAGGTGLTDATNDRNLLIIQAWKDSR